MSLSDTFCSIVLDRPPARFVMRDSGCGIAPPPKPAAAPSAAPAKPPPDLAVIRREAFAAGETAGRRAAAESLAAQQARWERLEAGLEQYHDNLERSTFEGMLDLSVKVSELILRRVLPDADMVRSVVAEIVGRVTDMERIQVRLHPEDAGILSGDLEEGRLGPSGRLEILADASLMPGDVMVENGFGCFDARLTERLNLLRDALIKRWRKTDADTDKTET